MMRYFILWSSSYRYNYDFPLRIKHIYLTEKFVRYECQCHFKAVQIMLLSQNQGDDSQDTHLSF